ncbi:phage tail sheath family protein [Brevibacillus ruminantium]|uniref:Phage tail sheath family protein n=1 Tax=Brevibacillus ruminantium TaxID=2950604 RepID=A0ABY4WK34_9BACL|nr:phage tail sheath family protein [Brevibacillus ruminantium]USG67447.1 phage tail sheath family protein [Brevibacillus ruminantium]
MAYKHGVRFSEVPTSVVSPVRVAAGLPVVIGTAPVHLAQTQEFVNKPFLAYTYEEAVKALGYAAEWSKYTLCEFMKSHFQLFNVAPIVFINVLDPQKHKKEQTDVELSLFQGTAKLEQDGVLLDKLVVKTASEGEVLQKNIDYTAAFDEAGHVIISRLAEGVIPAGQASLIVSYTHLDPAKVTAQDIIGGVNVQTGKSSGLELVNQVFPLFRLIPGQILAPGWSHDPVVAAVMKAKAGNINGLFKAISVVDVDSSEAGADHYTGVPAWKNDNSFTDALQVACWPKVPLGEEVYHLSTQFAGVLCKVDSQNDDIPYVSPSNKNLQANGAVNAKGDEITLGPDQAAYLNGEGIVTALNLVGGWKLWGNRTAAYPAVTDVKDSFIPVRRMFNWIGNTVIMTYWQFVDAPTNRRMIDTVVDSVNIWLNGLAARGAILGGRVEFRQEDNAQTDLLNGMVRFRLFVTPPVPAEDIEFQLEFDVNYLSALFAA